MTSPKTKPIAVVISDVHYNLQTLEVADKCLRQAVDKANYLEVPLIITGDLHDTKANLRGECVKAILDTLERCKQKPSILVGNHDKINEKSENNSLDFLRYVSYVIDHEQHEWDLGIYFIPYQHDAENMRAILRIIPTGSRLIIHQGHHGALPGGYSFDRSALSATDYAPFKVISGHYHQHQTFGDFTYIGNPYTLDFSEANHPAKGFLVLNEDFTFERVLTNVRKHVVVTMTETLVDFTSSVSPDDIVLVNANMPRNRFGDYAKDKVRDFLRIKADFRLEHIPTDPKATEFKITPNQPIAEVYYSVVQAQTLSDDEKAKVKALWKEAK